MSDIKKTENSKKNKKNKRKANSPLDKSGQTGLCDARTGTLNTPEVNKRVNIGQCSEYSGPTPSHGWSQNFTNMSNVMTSPIMNMSQNYPYLAQSPQMYQQLGTTPSQPPPWATAILEEIQCLKTEIQCIKQVLPQIDNIEKTVSKINAKVIDLERKSTDLDKRVDIIEASCQTMSDIVEQNKSNMLNVNSNLKETQKNISQLETDMKTMNKQMENYNNKALENEAKAMKDSLIFYGFEEDPGLTRKDESSNCEELLREFLGKFLLHDDEVGKIEIDNIYRVAEIQRESQDPF